MPSGTIRSEVLKLSKLSVKQPDYYFIQGYLIGLGALPQMLMPSQWQQDLFGTFKFEAQEQLKLIDSLMALYNQSMQKVMQQDLKMPAKCSLSKTDYRESIQPNTPLCNYCKGVLQALKHIEQKTLSTTQKQALKSISKLLKAFSNEKAAAKLFGEYAQATAQEYKRNYVYFMSDAIQELRFSNDATLIADDDPEFLNTFLEDENEHQYDEFDELLNLVLNDTELKALEPLKMLLELMESGLITKQFIKDNTGHFWLMHETRPYMQLRAHRARINVLHGNIPAAQTELEELLVLNPNDNQANRYLLMNCYIINGEWQKLNAFLANFDCEELHATASRALSEYHKNGESSKAKQYKKQLKQLNKHFIKILTGQEKLKSNDLDFYTPGSKEEVGVYLESLGKQAWIATEGSLFWLRKK
ncbi:UPF0149 family protein [Pseudoalteromonas sp.]|uniref:UPF0149 family protein n=1 Tax=Pseudoalteromonas sp. TaxID=53249 RepID=UPI003562254E